MAETSSGSNDDRPRISGREAIQHAREQLEEMMGRPVEAVLGMEREADGWMVTVQVVELQRIPNSTDVLGSYAVNVDGDGDVVGYHRTRRYYRSQADDG
ncbi:MAG: gas vesicle protein [Actinomycetota bacterium]|nr:gas vesicle protein [Actinomycetota bacterium]